VRTVRLFRKSEEKIALEASAQEEVRRLKTLSVEELAAAVLPALGPDGPAPDRHLRPQQACEYLLREYRGIGHTITLQLMARVRRALETLEEAGLVSSIAYERSPVWRITTLGTSALAQGTVERYLAGSEQQAAG
jgi:hypothetical protein